MTGGETRFHRELRRRCVSKGQTRQLKVVLGTFGHIVPPKTWGSTLVMPSKAEDVTNCKVEVGCSKTGSSEEKLIWGRLFI